MLAIERANDKVAPVTRGGWHIRDDVDWLNSLAPNSAHFPAIPGLCADEQKILEDACSTAFYLLRRWYEGPCAFIRAKFSQKERLVWLVVSQKTLRFNKFGERISRKTFAGDDESLDQQGWAIVPKTGLSDGNINDGTKSLIQKRAIGVVASAPHNGTVSRVYFPAPVSELITTFLHHVQRALDRCEGLSLDARAGIGAAFKTELHYRCGTMLAEDLAGEPKVTEPSPVSAGSNDCNRTEDCSPSEPPPHKRRDHSRTGGRTPPKQEEGPLSPRRRMPSHAGGLNIDTKYQHKTQPSPEKETENDLPAVPEVSLVSVPRIRVRTRPARTISPEEETPPPVATAPSPVAPVRKLAAKTIRRVTAVRQASAGSELLVRDTLDAYQATFRAAWEETHEGGAAPTWSKKETHMARSTLAAHFRDNIAARYDFLDFVVRHWASIVANKFNWMRQSPPPALPKIGFICTQKILPFFLDAYADRRRYLAIQALPAEERELAKLMSSGMKRDEALLAMGRRQGRSAAKATIAELNACRGDTFRKAEEQRRQYEQALRKERRRLAEERRKLLSPMSATTPVEPDFVVPDVPSLDELPPFDMSKWN